MPTAPVVHLPFSPSPSKKPGGGAVIGDPTSIPPTQGKAAPPCQPQPPGPRGSRPVIHALLTAGLVALALAIAIAHGPRPSEAPLEGLGHLQRDQSFAARACAGCHAIGPSAVAEAPEPGEPPGFQWIARQHPEYLDGFLLRPNGPHPLVTGQDASALRALLTELQRPR